MQYEVRSTQNDAWVPAVQCFQSYFPKIGRSQIGITKNEKGGIRIGTENETITAAKRYWRAVG